MIKRLLILILIVWSFSIYGSNLQFGYNYEEGTNWIKFVHSLKYTTQFSFDKNILDNSIYFKNTEKGNVFSLENSVENNFTDSVNVWCGVAYTDDEILNINKRLDWKVGTGIYIIKEPKRQLKLSYGLIYRDTKFYHSFRLKDNASVLFIGYKFKLDYIIASNTESDEIRMTLSPYINLFNRVLPGITFEYQSKEPEKYFGMRADLNLRF